MTEETIAKTLEIGIVVLPNGEYLSSIAVNQIIQQHEAEMILFAEWCDDCFFQRLNGTYVHKFKDNIEANDTTDLLTLFKNRNK